MATILHIQATATPSLSFSFKAAQAFLESYLQAHPQDRVETIDLVEENIWQFDSLAAGGKYKIMHGEEHTAEEAEAWQKVVGVIEEFKAADKYLFSVPMWNFSIPYRLKHYIDIIVQPEHTFSYSPEEGYKGLVLGRPALLILARGGNYSSGEYAALDFQRPYLETVLRFIGFEQIETVIIEPTLLAGPEEAERQLQHAIGKLKALAKEF